MKDRVIFLDVDGVLTTVQSAFQLDDSRIRSLNKLIKWFDADIVLSSTWRKEPSDIRLLNHHLKDIIGIEVADITGVDELGRRGIEIKTWLSEHPPVKDFIIVDDDTKDIRCCFKDHRILKTNGTFGLTDELVDNYILKYNTVHKIKVKEN